MQKKTSTAVVHSYFLDEIAAVIYFFQTPGSLEGILLDDLKKIGNSMLLLTVNSAIIQINFIFVIQSNLFLTFLFIMSLSLPMII